MATVATSTSSIPLGYPNARRVDRFPNNGGLLVLFSDGTNLTTRFSRDDFQTPVTPTNAVVAAGNLTYASLFIDPDDGINVGYVTGGQVYFVRGTTTFDGAGILTSIAWTTAAKVSTNNPLNNCWSVDLVAHREGAGWKAHVVWCYNEGDGGWGIYHRGIAIAANGTVTLDAAIDTLQAASVSGGVDGLPSVTIDSAKNLYTTWQTGSAGSAVFKLGTYGAGAWTWGAQEPIAAGVSVVSGGMGPCVVDPQDRCVALFRKSTTGNYLYVGRRSQGGGWTDISPSNMTAQYPALILDQTFGTLYVAYIGSGLMLRNYDGGWKDPATADSDIAATYPNARRDSGGRCVDVAYKVGTAVKLCRIFLTGGSSSGRRGFNAPIIGRGRRGIFTP